MPFAASGGEVGTGSRKEKRPRRSLLIVLGIALLLAAAATVTAVAANLIITSDLLTTFGKDQPGTSTCAATVIDDGYVDESQPGTNFGAAASLQVASARNKNKRTYLRFDIAACRIPSSSTVMSARLSLTVSSAPRANRVYGAHTVGGSFAWTEGALTWTSQAGGSFSATATDTQAVTSGSLGSVVTWEVRGDVQAFAAGGAANNGWALRDSTESSNPAAESGFGSEESARQPTLTITYTN